MRYRKVRPKTIEEIGREWDLLGDTRNLQIASGGDLSFSQLLMPEIIHRLRDLPEGDSVLDVGSGTGHLAERIAERGLSVVGVDPSLRSVAIARDNASNAVFHAVSVQDFAKLSSEKFEVAVSNMVLMDAPDLLGVLHAVSSLLAPEGRFISTITHPLFWPRYWGYESAEWFDYLEETFIEGDFKIASQSTPHVSTHIHRPISAYVNGLVASGFRITELRELVSSSNVTVKYPRFLLLDAVKVR